MKSPLNILTEVLPKANLASSENIQSNLDVV